MRVLLLNPPSYEDFDGGAGSRYQATREVTSFWYPTWLCYPAGLIKDSKLLDAPAGRFNADSVVTIAKEYDLVVIYTSTPSLRNDVKLSDRIKEVKPEIKILFVGPHPSVLPEETLKTSKSIDCVARGEFDYTVKELAENRPLNKISGISYRENGKIVHNRDRELISDLDSLPFVTEIYKRDLNIQNYHIPYLLKPYISIYTGRGCPSKCIFCLWPQTFSGNSYRVRSVNNVIEEIKTAKRLFPEVMEFFFDDDTFTVDRKRVRELSRELRHLNITWSTTSRANTDYETLKAMKDAGLRLLVVGYESGNAEILSNINKGVTLEQAREFTRNCKRLGIMIHGTFILGLPEESQGSIEDSINFAIELDIDSIQVSIASAYPGTEFYRLCKERGYFVKGEFVNEHGYQICNVSYQGLSNIEIFNSVERFYKKFYYRPRVIFRVLKRALFNRDERKRIFEEGREFKSYMRKRKEFLSSL